MTDIGLCKCIRQEIKQYNNDDDIGENSDDC
jgi:hypothetical protein